MKLIIATHCMLNGVISVLFAILKISSIKALLVAQFSICSEKPVGSGFSVMKNGEDWNSKLKKYFWKKKQIFLDIFPSYPGRQCGWNSDWSIQWD